MSSPHISFRLNHYHLAKALRILVTLEPNQPISSLSQAVKLIVTDWISKHSLNAPLETSHGDIEAIKLINALPIDRIDPYTTIKNIMAQAKEKAQPFQPQQMYEREQIQKSAQQIQRDLEDEKFLQQLKQESAQKALQEQQQLDKAKKLEQDREIERDKEIELQAAMTFQTSQRKIKPSEFHDPNITNSVITTVTDFSPPKEWIDSEG